MISNNTNLRTSEPLTGTKPVSVFNVRTFRGVLEHTQHDSHNAIHYMGSIVGCRVCLCVCVFVRGITKTKTHIHHIVFVAAPTNPVRFAYSS